MVFGVKRKLRKALKFLQMQSGCAAFSAEISLIEAGKIRLVKAKIVQLTRAGNYVYGGVMNRLELGHCLVPGMPS